MLRWRGSGGCGGGEGMWVGVLGQVRGGEGRWREVDRVGRRAGGVGGAGG